MFSPRHASSREWFRAGFFAALGAAVLGLLALAAWHVSDAALAIATPFVIGLMLALLLDPLADKLERRGLKRMGAVGIVFGIFLLLLVGFGYIVIPALIDEAGKLKDSGPQALNNVRVTVNGWLTTHKHFVGVKMPKNFDTLSAQLTAKASDYLQQSSGGIQGFLSGTVATVINIIITLIVTFFLLADIDRLRARLFYLLPDKARGPMDEMGRDIGGVFSDYLRGLLIVCTLYGITTIVMLYVLSCTPHHHDLANYALLVGTAAGVLYAVPYLGSTTTALVTFLVAFAAGGIGFGGLAVALSLVINQVFDNIVTPRVVGGGVGLNPVIAIFALILGAHLFGIWGMLLSVPVAASIQVILFRLFPKLTQPTPASFLRAQGVPRDQIESSKIAEGESPSVPKGPSQLRAALTKDGAAAAPEYEDDETAAKR
ncbi:MAG: AI-2E family transporter [Armatimonadetes bacterium]|nr:AI-2E family transporter [Armatimonadota bacterium]